MTGFQTFNDQGTLQFDSESPNYAFVGRGTIQTGDSGTADTYNNWSLAYVENMPTFDTIAISCRTSVALAGGIGFNDSNAYFFSAGSGSHTITYYLFRSYGKLNRIGGAGIETFTPGGQLSFTTGYRPLTVVAKHPVTSQSQGMSEGRGLPGGRDYAFIQYGSMNRDMGNGGGASGGYDVPAINFNGASAGARLADGGYYVEEVRGNGFYWGNPVNGGFLIADVTGL